MKHLRYILILLLVATALNVIVAMVCAGLPLPVEFDVGRTASLRTQRWDRLDSKGDQDTDPMRISGAYRSFGREVRVIRPDIDEPGTVFEHYSGWPLGIFKGTETVITTLPDPQGLPDEDRNLQYALSLNTTLKIQAPMKGATPAPGQPLAVGTILLTPHPAQILPLLPQAGGFMINTLFYILLIIAGPVLWMLIRGTYYRLKGRCPRCGYDLRHGPPDRTACPECGTRLKPDAVSPASS